VGSHTLTRDRPIFYKTSFGYSNRRIDFQNKKGDSLLVEESCYIEVYQNATTFSESPNDSMIFLRGGRNFGFESYKYGTRRSFS